MASTREERLQMRQRGAGTHKVKNVDFGLSFGFPVEPVQPELPRSEAQPEPAPSTVHQAQDSATAADVSQTDQRPPSRSPRSRNRFPERPSTFDIPVEDREELPRRKRRKISTTRAIESSPPETHDEAENPPSATLAIRSPPSQQEPSTQRSGVPAVDGRSPTAEQLGREATPPRVASGLPGTPVAGDEEVTNESAVASAARETERTPEPRQPSPTPPRNRQFSGREELEPTSSPTRQLIDESHIQWPQLGAGSTQAESRTQQRTRILPRGVADAETEQDQQASIVPSREPDPDEPRSNRNESISREAEEPIAVMSKKDRRKQRQKASRRMEDSRADRLQTPPTRESEQEEGSTEPEQEPTPEPEQDEETSQVQAETTTVSETPKRRGRPPGAKNKNRARPRQREVEADDESEVRDGEEPRQRGHTVAVTVHRLTNIRALEPDDSDVPSDSADESSDELAAERRNAKFPSRNGVNPADVLNQICRETLEKTVTALNNGIANESNQQRRAEWIRKRKAVEAYGVELSNRLLELSELLDSNFALGVKLKKAKREVGELRNRLLEIRKQRQEIGVRMDAVRRKHQEEESAKMSRNAINNALHNLELALDRNSVRSTDEESDDQGNPIAGLEFLVRSVSDTVSSASPGAQGGLLNQVKAFNQQLEKTLQQLER